MAMEHEVISAPVLLGPMQDGIELYWAESRYRTLNWRVAPGSGADGGAADVFVGLTMLLNFSTNVRDREAMAPLRHSLAFAECATAVFGGSEWPQRLAERLATARPSFVTAAIYVDTADAVVAETVQRGVDAVHHAFGERVAAVVVVSETGSCWSALHGVSGFIRGCRATTGETARQAFLMLAMLTAPNTLNGIDFEDLRPVLGSAASPVVLAEAVWLREGSGQLIPVAEVDARHMAGAKRVVATVFVHDFTWAEMSRFMSRLLVQRPDADSSILFAPKDALQAGQWSLSVGQVLCLCAADS